jgi:metallophosphoesterase (TIGR00282 family)
MAEGRQPKAAMRILFLGDIVGPPGISAVKKLVPELIAREKLELVIANAENASGGSGLTPALYRQLREAGVDAVTMGDHIYKRMELAKVLTETEPICKPANYPPEAPGRTHVIVPARDGTPVGLISLLGRLYTRPVDCPFKAVDAELKKLEDNVRCVIVDMHAEATGEKALMGRYLDGRVSAVLGTHTHVQTADERIFPGGTAFLTDLGMTGPYESILGRRIDRIMQTTITFIPSPFDVATDDVRLAGAIVDVDPATGKARAIRRVMEPVL